MNFFQDTELPVHTLISIIIMKSTRSNRFNLVYQFKYSPFEMCLMIFISIIFLNTYINFNYFKIVFQATIGIDFLSKTMYLEDRTVSY